MRKMFCVYTFFSAIHVEKFREKPYGGLRADVERFHQRECEGRQKLRNRRIVGAQKTYARSTSDVRSEDVFIGSRRDEGRPR